MGKKSNILGKTRKINSDAKTQDGKSLAVLLQTHAEDGYIPFHMPGHKRTKDYSFLSNVQSLDITEIEGFDNLHNSKDVLLEAQNRTAEFFGVLQSRYLTCGSTSGVLATIRALTHRGDGILVARNCHRSVYNAVEMCGLHPYYVAPAYYEEYGFYGSVMPEEVEKAFEGRDDISLVVITSPTYEGVISDIKSIAKICHSHGALLFVDEAHGAHLGLNRKFEQSARSLGADVVVNSLHKTLPSLTQTAVLHICTQAVDVEAIDRNLAVFETSSPSYVLMASIEGCIRYLDGDGANELDVWYDRVEKFRKSLSRCERIKLFDGAREGRVYAYDKTKLVILTVDSAIGGIALMKSLRNKYKIELEMASANYALALTSAGDTLGAYLALSEALFEIENSVKERYGLVNIDAVPLPEKAYEPYQLDALDTQFVDLGEAQGLVSAETVWAYPPSCPIICKGEIISREFLRYVLYLYECGVDVESDFTGFPDKILTVKQAENDEKQSENDK